MSLAERLATDGFAILDLLDERAVTDLLGRFQLVGVAEDVPFLATCNDLDRASAIEIGAELTAAVGPRVASVLPNHSVFLAGFICKGARPGGTVEFHQDLTYTDERRYRSLLLWIPLVDVDDKNGALQVVPGSHRWTTGLRVGGTDPLPTAGLQEDFRRRAVTLSVRAGQAVLYDSAMVHGSCPNGSATMRPVVAAATAPTGAGLVHFHYVDGAVRGWTIDDAYFTRQSLLDVPQSAPDLEPWAQPVDATSFANHLNRSPEDGSSGRYRGDAVGDVPPPIVPAPSASSGRRPLLTTRFARGLLPLSPRQALRDPSLDVRLRRDGFVSFPLISSDSAEALRQQYGKLHGWSGAGFEPDLTNTDVDYRRRVSALLAEALDPIVTPMFAGFSPYLRAFLCKWPGADSGLYLHRDWMYIDERGGDRSYVVWVALQDVTGEEGQIQVLRHSHRVDSMLRGTDLNAAWIQHEEVIREHLLTVPVRAGDALVLDNSVVHCSLPNHTEAPRVVAAVGVRPVESPLVHFRRRDDARADRYDVDEDFFLSTTPQALLEVPPDLPVAESDVPILEEPLGGRELLRRLGSSPLTQLDRLRSRSVSARQG